MILKDTLLEDILSKIRMLYNGRELFLIMGMGGGPGAVSKSSRRGDYVIVDGLDGVGKGVVERALAEYHQRHGRATFDVISHSKAHSRGLPELKDFWNPPKIQYHTIIAAEPTFTGTGHSIRFELIARNGRDYDPRTLIEIYSGDRAIQMKRVILPALDNGLSVILGRCVASTLVYQGKALGLKPKDLIKFARELRKYEGNRLQMENPADLLIIPVIRDFKELTRRLEARSRNSKDDDSIFENLRFQKSIAPFYYSDEMRGIFEDLGTKVEYLDVGGTVDETVSGAIEIYKKHARSFVV